VSALGAHIGAPLQNFTHALPRCDTDLIPQGATWGALPAVAGKAARSLLRIIPSQH